MYPDFRDRFKAHEITCITAATEGFPIGYKTYISPIHALYETTQTLPGLFDSFERYLGIQGLPICLSTRKKPDTKILTDQGEVTLEGRVYQSLFEDILDAWPVEDQPIDRPWQLYHPSCVGIVAPQYVADLAQELRDPGAIDARFSKGVVVRSQWISLLNIWIVADRLEDAFRGVIKAAGKIDTELLWQAIYRQLLKIPVEGESKSRDALSDNGSTPNAPDGPIPCKVYWDDDRLVLTVNGKPFKPFTARAKTKRTLLQSFQELGWPPKIPDPLNRGQARNVLRHLKNDFERKACPLIIEAWGDAEHIGWRLTELNEHAAHTPRTR
jgi:hypothetical protein